MSRRLTCWTCWTIIAAAAFPLVLAAQSPVPPQRAEAMRRALASARAEQARLQRQVAEWQSRLERAGDSHRRVLNEHALSLLNSADPEVRRLALQWIAAPPADATPDRPLPTPYSPAIQRRIVSLMDASDPQTASAAVTALAHGNPVLAARLGFQPGVDAWLPLEAFFGPNLRTRHVVYSRAVDLRGSLTVQEIADDLADQTGLLVVIHPEVEDGEQFPSTTPSDNLLDFADTKLEPRGLTILMTDSGVEILPTERRRARPTRTYHLRGAIDEQRPLEHYAERLRSALDAAEIIPLPPHRLVVTARETQQRLAGQTIRELAGP